MYYGLLSCVVHLRGDISKLWENAHSISHFQILSLFNGNLSQDMPVIFVSVSVIYLTSLQGGKVLQKKKVILLNNSVRGEKAHHNTKVT